MSIREKTGKVYLWVSAVFLAVSACCGPGIAGAQDLSLDSDPKYLKFFDSDNQVAWTAPAVTWRSFDTAYYNGSIYKMFCRNGATWEHDAIAYYTHAPSEDPASPSLTLIDFCDPPILNSSSQWSCNQLIMALRLVVFNGRLYLFYLKADNVQLPDYFQNQSWKLCYKYWDDAMGSWSAQNVLWSFKAHQGRNDTQRGGMVAKVVNGLVYLLVQAIEGNLHTLKFDGNKLVGNPAAITLTSSGDLILNGDVYLKMTASSGDHRGCIAFVTKDDNQDNPKGACKLYSYDPAAGSVTEIAPIPGQANGKGWKDLAVTQGNVDKCTPYSVNAIQLWGLPWDGKELHHTQFVFNDDGVSGSFNPSGWIDISKKFSDAKNSSYYKNDMRGLLAAAAVPTAGNEGNGTPVLQMNHWVWWFGRTTGSHCHGRSMKYLGDYLRLEKPDRTDTSLQTEPDNTWILLGIITGLPPYYPNGKTPEELEMNKYLEVAYGTSQSTTVSSTVTTESSFSFGYSQKDILKSSGVDGEFGISYSHAVGHTQGQSTTVKTDSTIAFNPNSTRPADYPDGSAGWALFLAPNIANDPYEVYTPPEAYNASHPNPADDTGFTVYHLYTNGTSLISRTFNLTNPGSRPYFAGMSRMPAAYDYDITGWNDAAYQRNLDTTDYTHRATTSFSLDEGDYSHHQWTVETENENENETEVKNTISVKAGAFGFHSDMEGSVKSTSKVKTTIGSALEVTYQLAQPAETVPEPEDRPQYLSGIRLSAYLLTASTGNAFFIPDAARTQSVQQRPWCLTWYVGGYDNEEGEQAPYTVGPGEPHDSVGEALGVAPGAPSVGVVLAGATNEPAPLDVDGQAVTIEGHSGTLDPDGRPTAVLRVSRISVAPGATLRLEDLIIEADAASGGAAALLANEGRLTLENCIVRGGDHGILHTGGSLRMRRVYVSGNGLDGLRMEGGYAELVNCEFVGNGGNGLNVTGGDARLTHCGSLGNGSADVTAAAEAAFRADNCLFGRLAPAAVITLVRSCLVHVMPGSALLEQSEGCLLNVFSGCRVENGEIRGLTALSPCVDSGIDAGVQTDILGRARERLPDIGPLEYTSPLVPPLVPAFSGLGLALLALLTAGLGFQIVRRASRRNGA